MKITKVLSVIAASAVAVTALAVSAAAYDLNKDLKTGWSVSTTVPGEEFEGATPDSVFTLTFTVDESLADKDGHNYWCVKPMINDTGWPFINNLVGPGLSEGGDSYPVEIGQTEMKFTIPAEELEHLQIAGMAFMGHGVTLGSLTFSNDEAAPAPADNTAVEEETVEDVVVVEETTTVTESDVAGATASNGNPSTGVEDLAGLTAIALASAGVMVLSRKRK